MRSNFQPAILEHPYVKLCQVCSRRRRAFRWRKFRHRRVCCERRNRSVLPIGFFHLDGYLGLPLSA